MVFRSMGLIKKYGILVLMIVALIGLHIGNNHLKSQISAIENKVETLDALLDGAEEFCSALSDDDSYKACLKRYDIETEYLRQREHEE